MKRKATIISVCCLALAAGVVAVFYFLGQPSAPPAEPPPASAEPAPPAQAAAEEPAAASGAPGETPDIEDIVAETMGDLDEPVDFANTLLPAPPEGDTAEADIAAFIAAMRARLGWDRLETLACAYKVDLAGMRFCTGGMKVDYPSRWINEFEFTMGDWKQKLYQVSDGVFMEIGTFNEEGERIPFNFEWYGGPENVQRPSITPELLDPSTFTFTEMAPHEADGSDELLRRADGSPIKGTLTRLVGEKDGRSYELFVESESLRPVALRQIREGEVGLTVSQLEYTEVADGILYPASLSLSAPGPWAGFPEGSRIALKMTFSEFAVNEPLGDGVFSFTSKAGDW